MPPIAMPICSSLSDTNGEGRGDSEQELCCQHERTGKEQLNFFLGGYKIRFLACPTCFYIRR